MAAVPVLSTHPESILLHYSLFQTLPVASNGMSCSLHSVILNVSKVFLKLAGLKTGEVQKRQQLVRFPV